VVNRYAPMRPLDSQGTIPGEGSRVVAVAGIARPGRFFRALRELGYDVARELEFPDHHWFTASDVDRISKVAREVGAELVVTTEKDAVRLSSQAGWAVLPMEAAIEPMDRFATWLRGRL